MHHGGGLSPCRPSALAARLSDPPRSEPWPPVHQVPRRLIGKPLPDTPRPDEHRAVVPAHEVIAIHQSSSLTRVASESEFVERSDSGQTSGRTLRMRRPSVRLLAHRAATASRRATAERRGVGFSEPVRSWSPQVVSGGGRRMKRRALVPDDFRGLRARRSSWWSPTRLRTAPDQHDVEIHDPPSRLLDHDRVGRQACSRRRRGTPTPPADLPDRIGDNVHCVLDHQASAAPSPRNDSPRSATRSPPADIRPFSSHCVNPSAWSQRNWVDCPPAVSDRSVPPGDFVDRARRNADPRGVDDDRSPGTAQRKATSIPPCRRR